MEGQIVDDDDAFARFQRNKSNFKEKNKVEIHLDTRYDETVSETTNETNSKASSKLNNTAGETSNNVDGKKEREDENGWTQSQQKALEAL